jgi:malate synthase
MSEHRVRVGDLQVAESWHDFIVDEVLPGTGIEPAYFWAGLASTIARFAPINRGLVAERHRMQAEIDAWHMSRQRRGFDVDSYREFLNSIGYLVPEGPDFCIDTENVDAEIAEMAGPQLVVPVSNARYALNAANARWGSLYDALYGSDALGIGPAPSGNYDPQRGAQVIAWSKKFLDDAVPIAQASHAEVRHYAIREAALVVSLVDGRERELVIPEQLRGFRGFSNAPQAVLFINNGLHIEIQLDRNHQIGRDDLAGVADVNIEAALTTIMDLEDSVAAVDPDDKVEAYRNWLGLCKGNLTEAFVKRDAHIVRRLAEDRTYTSPAGGEIVLPGRSVMLIRNVGPLMMDTSVLDASGEAVPEEILDAVVTSTIALHDLNSVGRVRNSKTRSIYIVKPKLHGPAEVAYENDLFAAVEDVLGLARATIKIGLMDEERRTTVNLKECIRAARSRIFFINTGFLDRTGDEIHTSMQAGPMIRKEEMRNHPWIKAYEDWNVDVGLSCGLPGRAQIGKGMWAKPDLMHAMLEQKVAHPESGANTAWVPSPTAATLHATHYHRVNVRGRQGALLGKTRAQLNDILSVPVARDTNWSPQVIREEVENNAQGILGYVVRWIDQGVGCSKVPDIHNVGLMEDRATLRISSQHIANWLQHGVVSESLVRETMSRMAAVVDQQNSADPNYLPMSLNFENSIAFSAACDLVFEGAKSPNGYTEPALHARRARRKRMLDSSEAKA